MKFIPEAVTRKVAMTGLKAQKNSPKILFAVGVVSMGATVVTACRATLKLEGVLDDIDKDLADAGLLAEDKHPRKKAGAVYTEDDYKKDKVVIYLQGGLKIVTLYAPSIALGVISVACFTQSHRILTKRNAGLSAALAIVEKSFADYRRRVVDELGEDKDREFYYGVEKETIQERTENGIKKKTVKTPAGLTMYARYFDEYNALWQPTPSMNEAFLRAQQEYANLQLNAKGYILLNDVYQALGFERTTEGCVVGWLRRNRGGKDGYVDFGLGDWPTAEDFATGRERSVLLDFNVDGEIFRQIGKF
jgi:hypothetical protein